MYVKQLSTAIYEVSSPHTDRGLAALRGDLDVLIDPGGDDRLLTPDVDDLGLRSLLARGFLRDDNNCTRLRINQCLRLGWGLCKPEHQQHQYHCHRYRYLPVLLSHLTSRM